MLWIFLGILIVTLGIGLPIAFGLGVAGVVLLCLSGMPLSVLIEQGVRGINSFPLLAIPFFILVGEVMTAGGIARRLVNLATAMVGFIRGGLGQVAVVGSMFFGGISGSAVADTAATCSMLVPPMKDEGYSAPHATAINTASSVIGIIIPPSIPLILYGIVTETSISRLFIAGVIPGVLIGLALMVAIFIVSTGRNTGKPRRFQLRVLGRALREAGLAMALPVIVIGGILAGVTTATEAAVAALAYALVLALFVYRELGYRELWGLCIRTARLTGMVLLLLAFATTIAWLLTINGVPQQLVAQVRAVTDNPVLLMIIVSVLLLVVGVVMDLTPAMVILAPMLTPIVEAAGISPVYFGVLMAFLLGIGLITPPVGTCLYVGCGVGRVSMEQLVRALIPFYIALLAVLALLIAFPGLVTWLPDLGNIRGN